MSYGASAGQIVGGIATMFTLDDLAHGIREEGRAKVKEIRTTTADAIATRQITPFEVAVTTPEDGGFSRRPGELLQRVGGQAPDRGWIGPVVLGTIGVGVLAWLYLRK